MSPVKSVEAPTPLFLKVNVDRSAEPAAVLQWLSFLEIRPSIGYLLSSADGTYMYQVTPRWNATEQQAITTQYNARFPAAADSALEVIECSCTETYQCSCCESIPADAQYDYSTVDNRLHHAYPKIDDDTDPKLGKLRTIAERIKQIDPEDTTEFDIRLNRSPAEGMGCDDVHEQGAREPSYGEAHELDQELKTLIYKVTPRPKKKFTPFTLVVNIMGNQDVHWPKLKKILKEAGFGNRFSSKKTNLSEHSLERGEVHPLSCMPCTEEGGRVVHIYDKALLDRRLVATNAGHFNWTTEFRIDEFIRRMQGYGNSEDETTVLVDDILKADSQTYEEKIPEWESEQNVVHSSEKPENTDMRRKIGVLISDSTTAFRRRLSAACSANSESTPTVNLHTLRQTSLDRIVVNYPQHWRSIIQELASAVALCVQQGITDLLLDCNSKPLEDFLAERLPTRVQDYARACLRTSLGDEVDDVEDTDLFAFVREKVSLLSKPTVVRQALAENVEKRTITDVFFVGGTQVNDSAVSKYHPNLQSVDGLTVHYPNLDAVRNAKLAMYYEESIEESEGKECAQLFLSLRSMLPEIRQANKPCLVLASTSLCQRYLEQGDVLISEDQAQAIAGIINEDTEAIRSEIAEINSICVFDSTEVYAKATADIVAYNAKNYGYSYA